MILKDFFINGDGDSFWRTRVGFGTLLLAFMVYQIIAGIALAQTPTTRVTACDPATPNNALCLDITAPSTNEDGTTTVMPITYRVQQKGPGATVFSTVGTFDTQQVYLKNLAPGTYTFRIFAISRGLESRASAEQSGAATAVPSPPNPPVFRVVQVIISMDHAPVYRLTQAGKRDERYSDACGYIEVGKACHGPVAFRFREKSFRRVSAADVKPWGVTCGANVAGPCG